MLSIPGIEPTYPALAGGFLTTGSPEKSLKGYLESTSSEIIKHVFGGSLNTDGQTQLLTRVSAAPGRRLCCRKPRVTVCQAGCRGSGDGGQLGWFCLPPGNVRFGGSARLSGAAACLSDSTSSCRANGLLCSVPKAPASRPWSKGHPVVLLDVTASYIRASDGAPGCQSRVSPAPPGKHLGVAKP